MKKKVLVTTYWSFSDALIQTYTLPYLKIMLENGVDEITLLTLEKDKKLNSSIIDSLKKEKINIISFSYSSIGMKMYFKLMGFIFFLIYYTLKNKITNIHGWCTPGGAIAYIISVITNKPLILDSFEPHAEIMSESNTWKRNSIAFKILFLLEKLQVKRASKVIACTESMKGYVLDKYKYKISSNIFYVKPACINLEEFSWKNIKNKELVTKYNLIDKVVGIYVGKFGGNYLKEDTFKIFREFESIYGDKFRVLLLNNHKDEELIKMAEKARFDYSKVIKLFVSHKEVPDIMGLADFAVTPFVPIPSKRHGTPIKDGEYWALGLPVIITKNISDDSEIIKKYKIGYELQKLDSNEFKNAAYFIKSFLEGNSREVIYNKIRPIAKKYRSFNIAIRIYKFIYEIDNKC